MISARRGYWALEGIEVDSADADPPDSPWLTPGLQQVLQHGVLPRLPLHALQALTATCRAIRKLVGGAHQSAELYHAAAERAGLPLSHPVFHQASQTAVLACLDHAAAIHATLKAGSASLEPR